MTNTLTSKVAIITGAGRRTGIGYGITRQLAQLGASLVLADICRRSAPDPEFEASAWDELVSIGDELGKYGSKHLPVKADITDPEEIETLLDRAEETFGQIDILVSNAGVNLVKPLLETTLDDWNLTMNVNAMGTFLCNVMVARRMIARGIEGCIVNISSVCGKEGWPNFGAYTASKFAVLGLTQTFAREMAPHGIRVNAVCPGFIDTEMIQDSLVRLAQTRGVSVQEVIKDDMDQVPLDRYGTPQDVAKVVAFLVSPDSSYMTGQALNVTGGMMVCR